MAAAGMGSLFALTVPSRRGDPLIRWWKAYAGSMAIWTLGRTAFALSETPGMALFWMRISYLGGIWLVPTGLWLGYRLIQRDPPRGLSLAIVLSFVVFSVFVFTPFFIPTVSPKPPFRFYDDNPGTIYVIWTIIFSLAVLIIHVSIYRALRQSRGYVFSRIGYFFASGLLIFVAGMSTFPLVFDKPVFPLGVPLIVGSLALMGYAVAQQRVKEPWVIVRNISVGVLVAMPTAGLLALLARAAGGGAGTFTIALFGASLFSCQFSRGG